MHHGPPHSSTILGLQKESRLMLLTRDWVAKCLGQMTESNKTEAQAELRKVIAEAFAEKVMWQIDWAGVQLKR